MWDNCKNGTKYLLLKTNIHFFFFFLPGITTPFSTDSYSASLLHLIKLSGYFAVWHSLHNLELSVYFYSLTLDFVNSPMNWTSMFLVACHNHWGCKHTDGRIFFHPCFLHVHRQWTTTSMSRLISLSSSMPVFSHSSTKNASFFLTG